MKRELFKIIAAVIAIIFSLLTIAEGSTALLEISVQDYTVFKPLLIYNIIMGIVGVFAGYAIWVKTRAAMTYTKINLAAHTTVMVIVIFIYFLSNAVAIHSVQAMLVRIVVWLVITLLVWKSNQSVVNQKNVNK